MLQLELETDELVATTTSKEQLRDELVQVKKRFGALCKDANGQVEWTRGILKEVRMATEDSRCERFSRVKDQL